MFGGNIIMSIQAMRPSVSSSTNERRQGGRKTDLRTFKRVVLLFRPYRSQMAFVLLAILITTALNLVVPLLIPLVFDDALAHRSMSHLILYGIIMIIAALLSGAIGVG